MLDLLGFVLAFAGGGGLAMFATSYMRTPRRAEPDPPTDCAHLWDGWTDPKYEPLWGQADDGSSAIIGTLLTQQRTCITCGYIEYRQESFKH